MKNPPTLADSFVGYSLRRGVHPAVAEHCRAMLPARKFVLDEAMTRYLATIEFTFASGTHKKRMAILDMVRKQARLPHELTWIELDPRPYRDESMKTYGLKLKPSAQTVMRRGFLLQQHPSIDVAFKCSEYHAEENIDDLTFAHIGTAWCCDDITPVPWRQYQHPDPRWRTQESAVKTATILDVGPSKECPDDFEWSDSEVLGGMIGYQTPQVHLIQAVSPALMTFIGPRMNREDPKWPWKLRASVRAVWLLLAMINDIPVSFEKVVPSKGYVARGSYKKFLAHSVIHLTVPQKQWRKVAARALIAIRRRAHQVRGFWRKDWRHPLLAACTHDFDDDMVCRRCGGHSIWVHEHQRGDASLGFVTHDYEVHHDKA